MSEAHAQLDVLGVAWRLGATLVFVLLSGGGETAGAGPAT